MKSFRTGDLVRFIGISGKRYDGNGVTEENDFNFNGVYVNSDMQHFLRGKIFRVEGVRHNGRVLIGVCEQTQDKLETQRHTGWNFSAGMFELYKDSGNETMEFTYDQLIAMEVREADV